MKIEIPYGASHLTVDLPDERAVEVVLPREVAAAEDPAAVVRHAVHNPLGDVKPPRPGQRVAIAINDQTRPVPHAHLLPPVLRGMRQAGVRDEDVLFIIATGAHPRPTPAECTAILPADILETYRVECHDCHDDSQLTRLGATSRGTPVWINSEYMAADYRIVIGNIEPHQFQGFSGGVKSAAIGLAGMETINRNHAMMRQPYARLGEFERNPARQDVEEIGRLVGIDFAVNALLDTRKRIVQALAGAPSAVMATGLALARKLYQAPVAQPFDLMIASPGGHPKDINLYQAQKGLAHAAAVTKDGGRLILCAACPQGAGSDAYESWVSNPRIRSHADVVAHFAREGFRVGPHKAFQIARDASRLRFSLASDMDAAVVERLLLRPEPDLPTAIDRALKTLPQAARIGIMPAANATMAVAGST